MWVQKRADLIVEDGRKKRGDLLAEARLRKRVFSHRL